MIPKEKRVFFAFAPIVFFAFAAGYFLGLPPKEGEKVYATYFGLKIKDAEVFEANKPEFDRLQGELNKLKKEITEQLVLRKIFEEEARQKKVSVNELTAEIESHHRDPLSEDEISEYIKNNPNDEKRMGREQLIRYVQDQKVIRKNNEYLESLKKKAEIKYFIPED